MRGSGSSGQDGSRASLASSSTDAGENGKGLVVERSQEWVGETHVADVETLMTTLLARRPLVER